MALHANELTYGNTDGAMDKTDGATDKTDGATDSSDDTAVHDKETANAPVTKPTITPSADNLDEKADESSSGIEKTEAVEEEEEYPHGAKLVLITVL